MVCAMCSDVRINHVLRLETEGVGLESLWHVRSGVRVMDYYKYYGVLCVHTHKHVHPYVLRVF